MVLQRRDSAALRQSSRLMIALGAAAGRACADSLFTVRTSGRTVTWFLWLTVGSLILGLGKLRFDANTAIIDTLVGPVTGLLLLVAYSDVATRRMALVRFLPPIGIRGRVLLQPLSDSCSASICGRSCACISAESGPRLDVWVAVAGFANDSRGVLSLLSRRRTHIPLQTNHA